MEEPFRIGVVAKLKHGILLVAMQRKGWSQAEFARRLNITSNEFGEWINLKKVPKELTTEQIITLYEITGKSPEQLWPEYMNIDEFLEKSKTITYVWDITARQMLTAILHLNGKNRPDELFDQTELYETLTKAIESLTPNQGKVLRYKFLKDRSEDEIAEELHLSLEKVRKLEMAALRKLRSNSITKDLKPFLK